MFFFLKPLKWAIKLAVLALFAAFVYVVVTGVQVVRAEGGSASPSGATPAVIVVSGSGDARSSGPPPQLVGRLEQAAALYHSHAAPRIVAVGPAEGTGGSVPVVAKRWLVANGIPAAAVTTLDSANASEFGAVAALLGRGRRVVVVTDAPDSLWARNAAASAGLVASVSPVPGSKRAFPSQLGALWQQATGVAAGRIIGYGRTGWAAS